MLKEDNVSPALTIYWLHPGGGLHRVLVGVSLAGERDGVIVVVTEGVIEGVSDKVLAGVTVFETVGVSEAGWVVVGVTDIVV